jgi:cytochrome b involved in lipid metabolism
VYDITEHLASHPGWEGAGVTTVLSIIAHLGTDCSEEFAEIHRPWPVAWRQLAAFDIGPLLGQ